jgi:hypothetical protein
MSAPRPDPTRLRLRPPGEVMRLARLGASHPTRLSFMRVLLRRMRDEGWRFERTRWEIDARGVGRAVLTAHGPKRAYSLVAFAHDLPPEQRSDRVIATAWDATFALHDGVPDAADLDRLAANVPKQEAGRVSGRELTLARANRSARLFDHVVEALAQGRQPDADKLAETGYLMRTTAVYGSAKFGAADRAAIADRPECAVPFQVEMLSVYLIRWFVLLLVEHMARATGGARAVPLDPRLARGLGIGNSTGLGMAPYLINHPDLLHAWIAARETAIARVRAQPVARAGAVEGLRHAVARACLLAQGWTTQHPLQAPRVTALRADLARLRAHLARDAMRGLAPWDRLALWAARTLSIEGQEMTLALMLEPHGALVDDLAATLAVPENGLHPIDGSMTVAGLRTALERDYGWALQTDWEAASAQARIWYISEEKLEPRLGERADEPLDPWEQPLAPGREAAGLYRALVGWPDQAPVAELLLAAPQHRAALRRVQRLATLPYGEIRDNTVAADLLPIDMLRCKLACFGATRFDPRSDRWVRITMFGGAPLPPELATAPRDDWVLPR